MPALLNHQKSIPFTNSSQDGMAWHGMLPVSFFFLKIMAGALPSIKVGNRGFSVQIAIPGLGRENDRNTTKLTEEWLSQSIYGPLS